jgi:hypothetical protein
MDGVIYKKFVISEDDDLYPLFGFACADYNTKYNADPALMQNYYIFGAVIQEEDMHEELYPHMFRFIKKLMKKDTELAMVVLGSNSISDEFHEKIMEELDGAFGFEELKDVYEDRIVFARKV